MEIPLIKVGVFEKKLKCRSLTVSGGCANSVIKLELNVISVNMKRAKSLGWLQQCRGQRQHSPDPPSDTCGNTCGNTCWYDGSGLQRRPWASSDQLQNTRWGRNLPRNSPHFSKYCLIFLWTSVNQISPDVCMYSYVGDYSLWLSWDGLVPCQRIRHFEINSEPIQSRGIKTLQCEVH